MKVFSICIALLIWFPVHQILDANPPSEEEDLATTESAESTIVSEREKVDLVEDSSVAEAMNRRPDLNFNNVTIDGEKTSLSLDDIPSDQVEAANVSKAVTPDLDADMRGGGLNLRSKPTSDFDQRVLKGSIESEYYDVVDAFRTDANLTYGKSFGRWGFIATASRREGTYGEEEYAQDWIRESNGDAVRLLLAEQEIDHARTNEVRDSINATMDFLATEEIRLYFKGDYRQSDRDHFRARLKVRHDEGSYENIQLTSADIEDALIERTVFAYESESYEYNLTTGGYFDFETISVDFQLSYGRWNYLEPDWMAIRFIQSDVDLSYDLSREDGPVFRNRSGGDMDLNDPSRYQNDWVQIERWEEDNKDWVGSLNIKVPIQLSSVTGHFNTGVKARGLEFFQDADGTIYDQYVGSFSIAEVISPYRNPDILDGYFDHGPFPAYGKSLTFVSDHRELFSVNETRSREVSDLPSYTVERDITAGYGLFYLKFNKLRIISGLRYEKTDRTYAANELILNENGEYVATNQLSDANGYANWFPGIHGSIDWGRVRLIGSWSNTIERPQYGIIVPYRSIAREEMFIEAGNPDLQPTLYANYDLSLDYELDGGNSVSLELFYQTVEDIVYFETSIIEEGIFEGYDFGTYRNGPTAEVQGLRLIWAGHLGDWLPFAEGLYLNTKYVLQDSNTTYPTRPEVSLPITRHPENEWEITLYYETERLFLQLDIQYADTSLEGIHESEPWRDVYEASYTYLNFSSSYEILDGIRVFLDVENVTGEKGGLEKYGNLGLVTEYELYPRHFTFGIRFDL